MKEIVEIILQTKYGDWIATISNPNYQPTPLDEICIELLENRQ